MNRGIAKRALFEDLSDARFFLARLVRQIRLGRIEVHAYCLMTTHFHLLVRSPVGALSEAMRRVQNDHSRRFNRRRKRDGPLIRGRYFSRPVRSTRYRRALVRYIDANPVRAGLPRSAPEHALGSAAAYLSGAGPIWLSRGWVEAEACASTGAEHFTPAAYRATFGTGNATEGHELTDFIQARITSRSSEDPLVDLIGAAPVDVQAWMRRKAKLADGHRVGLPVCGQLSLKRTLDEDVARRGDWMVVEGRKTWRGAELAWIGLLREMCGLSWQGIASLTGGSVSRAHRIGVAHHRLLIADPRHAGRTAEVGHLAIERCLGG